MKINKSALREITLSRLIKMASASLLLFGNASFAQSSCNTTNALVLNTGYDFTTGSVVPLNSVDPLWRITDLSPACIALSTGYTTPGTNDAIAVAPLVAGGYSWATNPASQWLCFKTATGLNRYNTTANVDYGMTLTRTFKNCTEDDYQIELDLSVDNYISDMNIDGNKVLLSQSVTNNSLYFHTFYTHVSKKVRLAPGTHYLNVTVKNYEPQDHIDNAHGLNVVGNIVSATGGNTLVSPLSDPNCCCSSTPGGSLSCTGNTVKLTAIPTGKDAASNCMFDFVANATIGAGWTPVNYILTDGNFAGPGAPGSTFYVSTNTSALSDTKSQYVPLGTTHVIRVQTTFVDFKGDTCRAVDTLHAWCNGGTGGSYAKTANQPADISEIGGKTTGIKIYPNPTNSQVNITSDIEKITAVQVYDIAGRKVTEYNYSPAASVTVSLEKLPAGTYTIKVNGREAKIVSKTE